MAEKAGMASARWFKREERGGMKPAYTLPRTSNTFPLEHLVNGERRHQAAALRSLPEHWMSLLDDSTLLSSFTIPGTHDSAAFTSPLPFIATQKMNISQQLDAGIRYFDLRCGLRNDIAEMVHGSTLLSLTLSSVLTTMHSWLDLNPREALIVQIKQDREPENSTLAFSKVIAEAIAVRADRWRTADTTPTLGETRGKIQLLRRYGTLDLAPFGIDVTAWVDNPSRPFTIETCHQIQLTVQDHYGFSDAVKLPSLLATKWKNVTQLLEMVANDQDLSHWYLNFCSASELSLYFQYSPHTVAVGGYWGFKWEEGINPLLTIRMRNVKRKERFGIVIMDFPEQRYSDLIGCLIRSNFPPRYGRREITLILVVVAFLVVAAVAPLVRSGRLELGWQSRLTPFTPIDETLTAPSHGSIDISTNIQ